jgi:DnaJ-class molecular chaperone
MAIPDPYQALGVSKTASQDAIKNAYRNLAKKYHPDLNPGSKEAERKFKEVSAAYDQIGTPEARAKFDRGESSFDQAPPRQGPFYRQAHDRYTSSFGQEQDEDLFSSIFGNRRGGGANMRFPGEDALYRMEVDLREATLGGEKEIYLPTGKKLSVRIPPGVTDGTRLRFAGQGGPGINGGPPGDAYVELSVRPDERFRREGDDLVLELPISLSEAILGGEVRVPTLDREVMLKIPPHSNSGTRLRLQGKGTYNRVTKRRGDERVILKVMLPAESDAELEEALVKWQQRHPYDPRRRKAA